jgi:FKBP-type peptidyl-prolyl cis-trans isomerase FkpA
MNLKYVSIGGAWLVVVIGAIFVFNTSKSDPAIQPLTSTTKSTKKSMTITQLGIEDTVTGTGDEAKTGDSVTVHYIGTLMDGTMFDASRNHGTQGFTFKLGAGQVIKGWDVGVAGMKVGGKRTLTIPSDMAYGNRAVGGVIPANSSLIFEVELLKVGK